MAYYVIRENEVKGKGVKKTLLAELPKCRITGVMAYADVPEYYGNSDEHVAQLAGMLTLQTKGLDLREIPVFAVKDYSKNEVMTTVNAMKRFNVNERFLDVNVETIKPSVSVLYRDQVGSKLIWSENVNYNLVIVLRYE